MTREARQRNLHALLIAQAVDAFDWYDEQLAHGTSPVCVACETPYALREGCDPSPLCDGCVHEYAQLFAQMISATACAANGDYVRASGDCVCVTCSLEYRSHARVIGFDFLHRLCDGSLVKL